MKHIVKVIPKEEILANRSNAYEFIDIETLEEFIESYVNRIDRSESGLVEKCIEDGAKWHQEQIGKSEFLQKLRGTKSDAEARRLIFEQFKNK